MLGTINQTWVDIQVSTEKEYPRHLPYVLNKIETHVKMDTETAEDCFYALRRGRGNDSATNAVLHMRNI